MSALAIGLLLLTASGITVSSVLAFWWAGKSGQFSEVERGAMSVFDLDELENLKPQTLNPSGNIPRSK